jgi:broad specificity phosphatase PhoE
MLLGLARHFQIPHSKVSLVNGPGFDAWSQWYDSTEVQAGDVPKAGETWEKCYCSDLPRAVFTAYWLYHGTIEKTPLLREVPYSGFLPRKVRFPIFMWTSLSRAGWFVNRLPQNENKSQTLNRIENFLEVVMAKHTHEQKILIVSHGFLMQYLKKALIQRGFRGDVPLRPTGGIIYPFESSASKK